MPVASVQRASTDDGEGGDDQRDVAAAAATSVRRSWLILPFPAGAFWRGSCLIKSLRLLLRPLPSLHQQRYLSRLCLPFSQIARHL
jgi:hypothetical protein